MSKKMTEKKSEMALEKENYWLLAIAFIIVVIGFLLMTGSSNDDPQVFNEDIYSFRRITLAPMVVLFGFLFGIYAIMKKPADVKKNNKEGKE
jgi:cell division protein FtsW (lipid II flippase)